MNFYYQVAKATGFRMERAKAKGPSHSCLLTHTESQERGFGSMACTFSFSNEYPIEVI